MATLGMEAMRATMLSIGTYFYPLRRLDDAADLLWAIFKYPAGLPNRVSKVKNAMSNADATDGLVQLMDRLGTMPAVKQLVDKLPPVDGMELVNFPIMPVAGAAFYFLSLLTANFLSEFAY